MARPGLGSGGMQRLSAWPRMPLHTSGAARQRSLPCGLSVRLQEASRLLGKPPAPATARLGSVFPAAWDSTARGGRCCPFRAAQKHLHMSPSMPAGGLPSALHIALPLQLWPCHTMASFAIPPECPAVRLKEPQGTYCIRQDACKQGSCASHLHSACHMTQRITM